MPPGSRIKSNVNVRTPARVGTRVTYHGSKYDYIGSTGTITASRADMTGMSTDGQRYTVTIPGEDHPLRSVRRQSFTVENPVTSVETVRYSWGVRVLVLVNGETVASVCTYDDGGAPTVSLGR